ncbi:MAG TPA: SMP-30/gluconolactonase/LRE family protein [Opitutus sp.]|nr:SMP-30/gluconolactonase/LRE family protein [Opitutus sp.]
MRTPFPLIGCSIVLMVAGLRADEFKGRVESFDPAFDKLVAADAKIEKLADGITWAEGPVWFDGGIIFSDVPKNVIYRWQEGWANKRVFLRPSGQLAAAPGFREPGSNGLAVDRQGRLLLCQCGERRIGRWEPEHGYTSIADRYDGKRFNTPNDLVVKRNGDIYFTDPPYGFSEGTDSKLRETPWHGVYRVAADGKVTLLTKSISYPNGIAFSPDEKTLYVSSTENGHAHIEAFDVQADGTIANGRMFFDGQALSAKDLPGVTDGFKVDRDGNVWTSGPGGILVVSPAGKLLGRINLGLAANCAWGDDGGTLYITASHALARVRTRTKGNGW